jgi:gamma-glutamylcyclotransferase (GGCT)/AIG2-like uncharacterized protein YtfP
MGDIYQVRLLVYGTLKDTWNKQENVIIDNCRIFDIGRQFPGMIMDEGESSVKCAIINVSENEIEQLDAYEGTEYEYFIRVNTGIDPGNIEYYRPVGALSIMMSSRIKEIFNDKPIDWMEYLKNENSGYTTQSVEKEELARLAKSR